MRAFDAGIRPFEGRLGRRGEHHVEARGIGTEAVDHVLRIDAEVELIKKLYNSAWEKNWGFVPLTESELKKMASDFKLILDPAITYIAYPNNPTANLFDERVVERIVEAVGRQDGLVVFDEAYQPFSSRSWMGRVAQHEHVLVMRTLSKFGLAGVRLGYMVGAAALIDEVDKVRPPYNISALNAEATLFALDHADEFAAQAEVLRAERAKLLRALADLPGAQPFPSEANMILVRVPDSKKAFEGMRQRGVLVKNIESLHPLLQSCLRLTVGTPQENALMIDALKASL